MELKTAGWSNLKLRIVTALVGLPLVLALLIFGGVEGVGFFAWVVSCGMLLEFSKMAFSLEDAGQKTALLLGLNTVFSISILFLNWANNSVFFLAAGLFVLAVFFLFRIPHSAENLRQHIHEMGMAWLAWAYCAWLPFLLIQIRDRSAGLEWLMLVFVIVWITDTGAYFSGRWFGSKWFGPKKLYAAVSPKKTWEGAFGGTLLAILSSILYGHYFFLGSVDPSEIALLAMVASVFSQMGDLFESLIKRAYGVKDSGTLLPGHGGFLDRFDGVLFAAPVVAFHVWLFY